MFNQSKKQIGLERNGALTVEVAMCLPLLILLLFGSYELARTNMILHATQSAAYEGARVGIVPGATPEKIEESVSYVLQTLAIDNFTIETIPAVIERDTESLEVIVRVPLRNNLSLPQLFVENPTFEGTCKLSREIP